jgi:hypothetical protein
MPSILIVEKLGEIKSTLLKTWNESELYKKAGLKTSEGFKCYTTWSIEIDETKYNIALYGKTAGRANQENKYEFPPPVDKHLFFGACILVNKSEEGEVKDLSVKEWEEIYESLYGGFEDLGSDSDGSDDDDDEEYEGKRTKDGYVKDGFVVDDDEEGDDDDGDDDDEEEEEPRTLQKPKLTGSSKVKSIFELKTVEDETYLDCTSELSEEAYIE